MRMHGLMKTSNMSAAALTRLVSSCCHSFRADAAVPRLMAAVTWSGHKTLYSRHSPSIHPVMAFHLFAGLPLKQEITQPALKRIHQVVLLGKSLTSRSNLHHRIAIEQLYNLTIGLTNIETDGCNFPKTATVVSSAVGELREFDEQTRR